MYQKCLYLKRRSKKGQIYYYCSKNRQEVNFCCYKGCLDKEYKTPTPLKAKKPIKKVSKNRKTVSDKTYKEVYERCNGMCAICGSSRYLEYHHIFFRSERPDLIDDPNNGIMLCGEFANNCHKGKAHKNKKYWQPILLDILKEVKRTS